MRAQNATPRQANETKSPVPRQRIHLHAELCCRHVTLECALAILLHTLTSAAERHKVHVANAVATNTKIFVELFVVTHCAIVSFEFSIFSTQPMCMTWISIRRCMKYQKPIIQISVNIVDMSRRSARLSYFAREYNKYFAFCWRFFFLHVHLFQFFLHNLH